MIDFTVPKTSMFGSEDSSWPFLPFFRSLSFTFNNIPAVGWRSPKIGFEKMLSGRNFKSNRFLSMLHAWNWTTIVDVLGWIERNSRLSKCSLGHPESLSCTPHFSQFQDILSRKYFGWCSLNSSSCNHKHYCCQRPSDRRWARAIQHFNPRAYALQFFFNKTEIKLLWIQMLFTILTNRVWFSVWKESFRKKNSKHSRTFEDVIRTEIHYKLGIYFFLRIFISLYS